jgi:hypothetical protein
LADSLLSVTVVASNAFSRLLTRRAKYRTSLTTVSPSTIAVNTTRFAIDFSRQSAYLLAANPYSWTQVQV